MNLQNLSSKVTKAHEQIKVHILKTPLLHSYALSEMIGGEVYLKLESEQHTGSFKARGSLNKLLNIKKLESAKPVITASTGNHGLGFARAVGITGLRGTVYLPHGASEAKIKKLGYYPVTLMRHGDDPLTTELHAREVAESSGAIWVSPYNDTEVIAGQGTIAIEILDQLPEVDDILITMGGGGLISGIGAFIKHNATSVNIIGCEPINSKEMTLSLLAGKIVDQEDAKDTLSDGSAGGIEPGAITFDICQQVVDHSILVSEEEIKDALKMMIYEHGKIIEGAAAVTIASLIKDKDRFKGRKVVLVICGSNIDIAKLKKIL